MLLFVHRKFSEVLEELVMSFPHKTREKVLELLAEGMSPEQIEAKLTQDPSFRHLEVPCARTMRIWKHKYLNDGEQQAAPTEDVILHDRDVFRKLDDTMNEQQFHAYFYSLEVNHDFASEIAHKP